MNNGYVAIFVIVWFIVAYFCSLSYLRTEKIAKSMTLMLAVALVTVSVNIVLLMVDTYMGKSVMNSLHFICMDWLLYFIVRYAVALVHDGEVKLPKNNLIIALLAADSLSMLINPITEHALTYNVEYTGEMMYVTIVPGIWYMVHLVICYVLIAVYLIILFSNIVKSPDLYKRKYIMALIAVFIGVASDAVFLILKLNVDIAIISYALSCVLLYYFTFSFTPRRLKYEVASFVNKYEDDMVVVFDAMGNKVMSNISAKQVFGFEMERDNLWQFCERFGVVALNDGNEYEITINCKDGSSKIYKYRYRTFYDKNRRPQASFFTFSDITAEKELIQRFRYSATHDKFTGLYNRDYFIEKTKEFIEEYGHEPLVIVCSDIGRFKMINDMFGEAVGDEILLQLTEYIRTKHIAPCVYGRLGNDQFAMCFRKADLREEDLYAMNIKIRACLPEYHIMNYYGIYEIQDTELSVDLMIDRAIMAINRIKGSHSEAICYFSDEHRDELLYEQKIIADFKAAIEHREFEMYLQPQIDCDDNSIVGAEALVRWKPPGKAIVRPDEFVPILEKNGLVTEMDQHMWRLACEQLLEWKKKYDKWYSISVNISTRDFYYCDVYDIVVSLVEEYKIPPASLKLEVTESAFANDRGKMVRLIKKLREYGFIIEMDDFGSGYSSLNMLKDLDVNILKMDMRFFEKSAEPERGRAIVRAVIKLAEELKLPIIAEGVENQSDIEFLHASGCRIIQGYFYGKPMQVNEYEDMLKLHKYKELYKTG